VYNRYDLPSKMNLQLSSTTMARPSQSRLSFLEANEAVILEANEAVVFEANEAVVFEANEAVIFEANEAVVFEVRTHCCLVQRCGRETEGSSCTGFGR
jgi:hypothetical protein